MLTNNFAMYGMKIFVEIGRDVLFFPLWWYTRGLVNIIKAQINFVSNRQKSLALFVWIKNIFKPMYGQRDWQGILISIFIRLIQIFFRSIMMIFWVLITILLIIVWIALPLVVVFEIFFQII